MSVNYILEDDLLQYLKVADAAVNLTSIYSDWTLGLSKAYREILPKVYSMYRTEQLEEGYLHLGDVWAGKEDENAPTLLCGVVKSLAKNWNDKDIIKEVLVNIAKRSKPYNDVIMPITIIGSLEESIMFMREALAGNTDTNFWVGISKTRAEESEFKRDKFRVFVTAPNVTPKEKIYKGLEEELSKKGLSLKDVDIVTMSENKDKWDLNPTIRFKQNNHPIERIAAYSDIGYAFLDKDVTILEFNIYVQSLRKAGLDISFVRV